MRRQTISTVIGIAIVVALAVVSLSLNPADEKQAFAQPKMPAMAAAQPGAVTKAVCVVTPLGDSKAMGKVTFMKEADGVLITAEFSGLTPGDHGFHVHQWGDISAADGTSTGGHFNPENHDHGRPEATDRHVGDFGNLTADAQGNAKYSRVDKVITLSGPESIIGRGIIVHANPDDFSQPTGNAGGRVASGVIGIANPAAN
jgi:superoxide dismutase, Cu-Zn family